MNNPWSNRQTMQRFLGLASILLLAVALVGSMLCFIFRDFLARFPTSSF